jgi:hypothetical protein
MRKITKKIAVAFTALFITAGVTTIKAQTGAALNIVSTATADAVVLNQAISTNSLVGKTKITVEAWVRPTTLSGNGCIVGNYTSPLNQLQFLLRRNGTQYLFLVGPGNAPAYMGVTTPINTATVNIWQHVACVYDGTVTSVFINGVLSATNSISSYTFATNTNSIIIGTNSINESYNGDIDELRIWNTNRSKCEISTFMNCEIPTNATNLIANYHFNQGVAAANNSTVTTLFDATSNGYNGTLNNFALTGATGNWVTPGGVVSNFTTSIATPGYTNTALGICPGGTVALGSTNVTSFTWTPTLTNNAPFTPTASTSYSFTGTNSVTSCSISSVANITVNPNPTVTAVSSATNLICIGQTATITAGGANSYVWNTTATTAVVAISPTVTTTYTVTGTNLNGCSNVATVTQSVSACTGIVSNLSEVNLEIYPNPSTGLFNIKANSQMTIEVFDMLGSLIIKTDINAGDYKLNLEEQNKGLYIVKCTSQGQVRSYRLIKE